MDPLVMVFDTVDKREGKKKKKKKKGWARFLGFNCGEQSSIIFGDLAMVGSTKHFYLYAMWPHPHSPLRLACVRFCRGFLIVVNKERRKQTTNQTLDQSMYVMYVLLQQRR